MSPDRFGVINCLDQDVLGPNAAAESSGSILETASETDSAPVATFRLPFFCVPARLCLLCSQVSCLSYNEGICQMQDYTNENCREIKAPTEGNLQEGGKRDALKERKTRRKRTIQKVGLGKTRTLIIRCRARTLHLLAYPCRLQWFDPYSFTFVTAVSISNSSGCSCTLCGC